MRRGPAQTAHRHADLPHGARTGLLLRGQDALHRTAARRGRPLFPVAPRRFGKSLFLDTLKELFEGTEALFTGLHIHDRGDWNWSVRHPVVRLDFAGGSFKDPGYLQTNLAAQLDGMEVASGVSPRYDTPPERFGYLLRSLHERSGQRAAGSGQRVAVLVDEYDKPILDALDTPEIARAYRDYLRGLYGVIKASDAHVRFTFVTGVSKFTKVSRPRTFAEGCLDGRRGWDIGEAGGAADGALFSDLNNLADITLDPAYSSICGYTEGDLETVFAPELAGLDRERVREWYNGYSWLGAEKVYNPYDVLLLLLRRRKFAAHWFETGTPAFLVDTLFERQVASVSLDDMIGTEELLSAFDVGSIGTEALLFQTGYLTIMGEEELGGMALYRLGYPNREVRQSLNRVLLRHLVQDAERQTANSMRLAAVGGARLRGAEGTVPRVLREHSVPVVHEQPDRPLRGLLRMRGVLLLRGVGVRDHGGGVEQPRAAGLGSAHRRPRVPVRVQGRGDGAAGRCAGAVAGARLRGQVPGRWRADPPYRGGVQPRDAQRDRVRGGGRLSAGSPSRETARRRAPFSGAFRRRVTVSMVRRAARVHLSGPTAVARSAPGPGTPAPQLPGAPTRPPSLPTAPPR